MATPGLDEAGFSEPTAAWFRTTFGEATRAQAEAWPAAARTALSARGVAVGEVTRERSGDVRLQLELPAP